MFSGLDDYDGLGLDDYDGLGLDIETDLDIETEGNALPEGSPDDSGKLPANLE